MKTPARSLVILGFMATWSVLTPAVSLAQAQGQAAAPFEIVVHRHVMVKARDGVRLATDIYLPARNGKCTRGFGYISR